jgi:hypothetical protein
MFPSWWIANYNLRLCWSHEIKTSSRTASKPKNLCLVECRSESPSDLDHTCEQVSVRILSKKVAHNKNLPTRNDINLEYRAVLECI